MSEQTAKTRVLDLLKSMTAASFEATTLDPEKLMLVRLAALVAVDAPLASYLMNLRAAEEFGFGAAEIQAVLVAVAPIVGTPKVVSATGKIVRARGLALDLAEFDGASEEEDTSCERLSVDTFQLTSRSATRAAGSRPRVGSA